MMLPEQLLSPITTSQITDYQFQENQLLVAIKRTNTPALCPYCQQASTQCHSHSTRCVQDLPCGGLVVFIPIQTQQFFCTHSACACKIFCDRLGETIPVYARKSS